MRGYTINDLTPDAIAVAVREEADYYDNLLPPEPFLDAIAADSSDFADAVHRSLEKGRVWPPAYFVDARKPGHGVRPIGIIHPEARALFRALTKLCVPESARPDRSAKTYAKFIIAPINVAYAGARGLQRVGDTRFSHIITSDITAFYQYVDHQILASELDLLSGSVQAIDALISLLGEIQQRTFGLPQRSEPSDWLSEVYMGRIDRWLARRGWAHWRYNDDIRIGAPSYEASLQAIETLAAAARDAGLVLNDQKTTVLRFLTYLSTNSTLDVDNEQDQFDPSDVEAAVSSDYLGDDQQARQDACEVVDLLYDHEAEPGPSGGGIKIRRMTTEEHRRVRRAVGTLARLADDYALEVVLKLLAFQPAMTHTLVRYLIALSSEIDVSGVLDRARGHSLSDWQRAWITYGYRACDVELNDERATWLGHIVLSDTDAYSAAEAALTLARAGSIDFSLVEDRVRRAPSALTPWYLAAANELRTRGHVSQQRAQALADTPTAKAIHRWTPPDLAPF